ncbi:MAG: hypothetical protein II671_02835 [Salinivirgaceae bacterium]|nr:hypothetical protein [Salinivirgaceae bacterium]
MKPIGYVFLGIVIGVAITLAAALVFAAVSRPAPIQDKDIAALDKAMDKEIESLLYEEPSDTNYYNIETKKGKVVLFTGMTKDSIISLLGEPKSFYTSSVLGIEKMQYDVPGGGVGILSLSLAKGKLTDVSKY